jgi:hypothetical protein
MQRPFHQSLVAIDPVVSENIFFYMKAQLEPNFDGIVIEWSFSKIVSGSRALPPTWPPQCSCVVIESSFDPGERLQAAGSLWLY